MAHISQLTCTHLSLTRIDDESRGGITAHERIEAYKYEKK